MPLYSPSSRYAKPLAIALIVLGILCIALPFASSLALTMLFACAVALTGFMHLLLAFRHQHIGSRIWHILAAVVLLAGGILLAVLPMDALASFTLVIAALFVMVGLMRVFGGFAVRSMHGAIWMLVDGAVTALVGLALLAMWPIAACGPSARWSASTSSSTVSPRGREHRVE